MSLLMVSSTRSPVSAPRIKKGREGPLLRTASFAGWLAPRGGARSYDYQGLSNKIAHHRALPSFPCAGLIRISPRTVKRTVARASAEAFLRHFFRIGTSIVLPG